jgi:hypothetical protein
MQGEIRILKRTTCASGANRPANGPSGPFPAAIGRRNMSDMSGSAPRTTARRRSVPSACAPADDRYDRLRRPCPVCGELGARIVYGYPSGPLVRAAARGQLVLGGCTYRAATHRCAGGHEWESVGS